jgi:hypothetical protein
MGRVPREGRHNGMERLKVRDIPIGAMVRAGDIAGDLAYARMLAHNAAMRLIVNDQRSDTAQVLIVHPDENAVVLQGYFCLSGF